MSNTPNDIVNTEKVNYETFSIESTASKLETNVETGLSSEEAQRRLELYGPNKLEEKKKKTWIQIFFEQLNNPMIFVLFGAILITIIISIYEIIHLNGIISNGGAELAEYLAKNNLTDVSQINWFLDVGDWPDVVIILAVVILNSIIGTVQEIKAQTSLDALKNLSSPESTVVRDGKRFKIKSQNLVLGDIVILEEGDTIGADLRLVESVNLKANESSLTGESVPVEKDASLTFSEHVGVGDRLNMLYMSTPVSYGRGKGIVTGTGMNTEIGKIASALDEENEGQTPLQKALAKLSKFLGLLTLFVVIFVLAVSIVWIFVKGQESEISAWIDTVLSSIALAVAAIPEGLAAVVTIVLSIGVQRMVKVNTVVRKLPSVETLGAVGVVCSDKTGTLTQNKMTVLEAYTYRKYYKNDEFNLNTNNPLLFELAKGMSLCSNATVDEGLYGDPTEIALVNFAKEFGFKKKGLESEKPRVDELPFDSVRKMMSTKHKLENGQNIIYTKGALDSILSRAKFIETGDGIREITHEDIDEIYSANKYFSDKALRVLALSYTTKENIDENDLIFVGLVAMIDPPREEAKPAVAKFKDAGIITVMITGDHKDTAFAIAKELGIASTPDQCMMGHELDSLSEEELIEVVKRIRVFARVSPENKTAIVKAFKANGHICAMTGDGVNDAPSLKAADIGIAMGITGTDVAKGAADMVLTDDNFASIQKAVEEGRNIYANIKKTVIFLLSSNISEVLTMFIIICLGFPQPLIAIHLLWVNLITDSLPAIALGMDSTDPNVMREKPRDPNEGIFARGGLFNTILYGVIITLAVLLAYFSSAWMAGAYTYADINTYFSNPDNLHLAQTMAFTTLAISELFHMLGMSNLNRSFVNVFKNRNIMMLIAFIVGLGMQLLVIQVGPISQIFNTRPLEWFQWLVCAGLALIPLIAHEIIVLIKKNQK